MDESTKQINVIRNRWGFYQYAPLPSEKELQEFYEKKYYQEGRGSYEITYSEEETAYFKLAASLIYLETIKLSNGAVGKTLLDVGCGEGWIMDKFFQSGVSVAGLDFSRFALEKIHTHLLPFFEQGDIYTLLREKSQQQTLFDFVVCANVLEHVLDPVGLLSIVRNLMHPHSLLVLIVPNDFSALHAHLLKTKRISKEFWLCYPDHLSYFNKDGMEKFLKDSGFSVRAVVADNPIDLNLLNDNSNYIEDRSKGKNTHLFRVRMDNFLASIDEGKLLSLYEVLGSMGVGRDLTYYCHKRP
jgi:2-polyprenyl-3-methyl-5-hydroxy-6-metoxy-1,4-benzoquinol methylase